jgi:hypothetical protein
VSIVFGSVTALKGVEQEGKVAKPSPPLNNEIKKWLEEAIAQAGGEGTPDAGERSRYAGGGKETRHP